MLTTLRTFRTHLSVRLRTWLGAILALNDPQWGRRNNEGPPDLDELVRNFKRKINNLLGGRKGGGPGTPPPSGGGGLSLRGGGFLVGLIALVWLASGFYIVDASERGVVLRFGKFISETQPGPNWHLPFPIETVDIVNVSQVRTVEIGYRGTVTNKVPRESLMLTNDENIVDIQFAVQYVLKDPREFLFNNRFPEDTVMQASETAIREIVGNSTMDFVLYEGRAQVTANAQTRIQQILDRYVTGISISKVTMQNAQPPEQVQTAFDDAVRAGQDRERQKNEGEAYANDVIPRARGAASRLAEEANGYRERVIQRAEGDASRFRQIVAEYSKAPRVTRDRLYLEAIEDIMQNTNKVMIDQKSGSGNLLYLPLDKILQSTGAVAPTGTVSSGSPTTADPTLSNTLPEERSRDAFRNRDREGGR